MATVVIYTLHEVKEEFTKYSGGYTKLAIMHIQLFKLILNKCNFCKEQEIAQRLLDKIQMEYNELNTCASTRGKKLE